MFIVTNTTSNGEYTPSLFNDERKAYEWFYSLIVNNLIDAKGDSIPADIKNSRDGVLSWGLEKGYLDRETENRYVLLYNSCETDVQTISIYDVEVSD